MKKLFILKILLSAIFVMFMSISCEETETEENDAPQIPPESTMLMDFSDFSNPEDTTDKANETYIAWGHSAFNVLVWNAVITVGLAVPVTSFTEAFNHQAEYHADENYWTWTYGFNANGQHQAELKGYLTGDTVTWEMKIDDFLWYYGNSHLDRTGGYWILNESKQQPTPLLRIEWARPDTTVASISYTNIAPEESSHGAENGGYIAYGITEEEFNRYYDIYNKGQDNLIEIQWNFEDKHGRVKDYRRFLDENWHCWDTTLQDTDCN